MAWIVMFHSLQNIEAISLSDPPISKENAVADGPRNGAPITFEAEKPRADNTAWLEARHPIIARHWGIAT